MPADASPMDPGPAPQSTASANTHDGHTSYLIRDDRTSPGAARHAPAIDLHGCFRADGPERLSRLPECWFADPLPVSLLVNDAGSPSALAALSRPLIGVGTVLDRYRLECEIGSGGFAIVYRAQHILLRTPVAIKLLRPGRGSEADLEALCEEARFAAMVAHANVVRVFDVVRSADAAYIVMEYVDGPSLAQVVRDHGPLDPLTALDIALGACDGLAAALACGLIHRDVKPGNLLLRSDQKVLLADFGLARQGKVTDDDHENAPLIAGTPAYMAPEQAANPGDIDHRADMYALGATLFHLLTGSVPYDEHDPLRAIGCHLHKPVPDPRRLTRDLPDELADLVMELMAKDRADRPGDYRELRQLLNQVRDSLIRSHRRPRKTIIKRLQSWFQ